VARNIEIKARVASIEAVMPRARALAARDAERIEQDDTFFRVSHGRLKLRRFADGGAELIHYERADTTEAKLSDYRRVPMPDAAALREALDRALGTIGRVRKQRWLLLAGQTRIHLDRVEGLGDFVELEVVLNDEQSAADGMRIAEQLMHELGVARAERIAGAYLDLLATARP
jgi:predicted adenylyl cyclase CyaB